jgi:sortase A
MESNNLRKYYIIFAIALVAIVVFVSGCTSQTSIPTKTYSAGGMSFDYPDSWNLTSSLNGNSTVITLSDPEFTNNNGTSGDAAIILRVPKTNNVTLDSLKDSLLTNLKQTSNGTSTTRTVNGINANETTYNAQTANATAEIKIIDFEKNNFIYLIMLATINKNATSEQKYYDVVINSFKPQ